MNKEEFIAKAEEKAVAAGPVWRHNWFTTIIPCGTYNEPMIISYCPNCRKAVTQALEYGVIMINGSTSKLKYGEMETSVILDREGCVGPPVK